MMMMMVNDDDGALINDDDGLSCKFARCDFMLNSITIQIQVKKTVSFNTYKKQINKPSRIRNN